MKSFEEICKEYNKAPEQVESDMMDILLRIQKDGMIPKVGRKQYQSSVHDYLISNKYFELALGKFILTNEGEECIQEGYVFVEPQANTSLEDIDKTMTSLAKIIAFLTTFWGFLKNIFGK